jgi:hypothetical protein
VDMSTMTDIEGDAKWLGNTITSWLGSA